MKRALWLVPAFLVTTSKPHSAEACGGFFCSQAPVIQTAEQVVFEVEGDEISAYISVQFQGPDEDFAWIVPVPEVPEVEVGIGAEMFRILDEQTAPQFEMPAEAAALQTSIAYSCGGGFGFDDPEIVASFIPPPDVEVLRHDQVGPYEVAAIDGASASDLNDWLRIHGYRVTPGSDAIVQSYLDAGMKLLALRLSPEATSGSIEPIKLTYHESRGCAIIPIRLTAIAAAPGLEIVTWVFGSARAIPENYAELEVDLGLVMDASQYPQAIQDSVRAAEGHGFRTEYARPSANLASMGDPTLETLLLRHGYVTRMRTYMDPVDMTVDPGFKVDASREDVSNQVVLGGQLRGASASPLVFVALALLLWRRRS